MTNIQEICLYSMFLKKKKSLDILSFTSLNTSIGMISQALVHSSLFCQFSRKISFKLDPSFTKMYRSKKSNAALT